MSLIRSIEIGISVNTRDFAAKMASAERIMARFAMAAARIRTALGSINLKPVTAGLSAMRAGAGNVATTLGTIGAALGGKEIIGVAIGMEDAMVNLAKAADLDPAGMAAMKSEIFGLATSLKGVKLEDLFAIATSGAKLGVAAGDLKDYTEGVAKLSIAMDDVPTETIADSVGKINNVFKLGNRGALQIGSAIDKLADSGVASAEGIFDVTARLSGLSQAMKLSAPDTIALSAALLNTGTHAEAAAGSLTMLLGSLIRVDNHAAFAQVMGVDVAKFSELVRTKPIEAIEQFLQTLKGLDANSQLEVLDSIGINADRGATNVQKLAQQVDSLKEYTGLASHEFDTLDQITKSYNINSEKTSSLLDQATNQLKIFGDQIGQAALPSINAGLQEFSANGSAIGDAISSGISIAADAFQILNIGMLGGQALLVNLEAAGVSAFVSIGSAIGDAVRAMAGMAPVARDAEDAMSASLKASAEAADAKFATANAAPRASEGIAKRAADTKAAAAAALAAMPKAKTAPAAAEPTRSTAGEADAAKAKRKADKKAATKMAADAKKLIEDTRTPAEQYQAKLGELDKLFAAKAIDSTTFARGKVSAREDAFGKDEPKFAGAMEANSAEAYSAQLKFMHQESGIKDEPIKEVAKKTGEQVDVSKQILAGINRLVDKTVAAGAEMFAF